MWADGERMGQIMYLLGVKPKWLSNGRVKGFEIIPISELGRSRIDVTIRVSGITRANFPMCIELIDEAIQKVAALDEPEEMNFIRKHTLEQLSQNGGDFRSATLKIFCSTPGTAHNPYALEEIARRLIEAMERGLWNPAEDVKEALKLIYLEIEGWIEEKIGETNYRYC